MPNDVSFSQQLAYLEKGGLDREATDLLAELVQAVKATRRKGSITVTISMSMDSAADSTVKIKSEVKAKIPEFDRPSTFMFVGAGGALLRNDPEQRRFPLEPVSVDADGVIQSTKEAG
jgi:hypothetical protein